jgi:hypothetical protein
VIAHGGRIVGEAQPQSKYNVQCSAVPSERLYTLAYPTVSLPPGGDATPSGLLLAAENGGTLSVSEWKRERFDLSSGEARFTIVFAPIKKE